MCEIIVARGVDQVSNLADHTRNLVDCARIMYRQNSDGLGAVAVMAPDEAAEFSYGYYKVGAHPDWMHFTDWLADQLEAGAWRVCIHARLATVGAHTTSNAHPLIVDCPECDGVAYVVHNGVISDSDGLREAHEDEGHQYATPVDSECIAHAFGDDGGLPDEIGEDADFQEPADLRGTRHYLLFSPEGILVRSHGKYRITDDFTMTCRPGWLPEDHDADRGGWLLVTPDRETQYAPVSRRVTVSGGWLGRRTIQTGWGGYGTHRHWADARTTADDSTEHAPRDSVESMGHPWQSWGPRRDSDDGNLDAEDEVNEEESEGIRTLRQLGQRIR